MLDLIARRFHDLQRMHPAHLRGHGSGVDARHVEDVLEEPREPFDFRERDVALFATVHF